MIRAGAGADAADRAMLELATRAAQRAVGDVEPNPLVGAVIGRREGRGVRVLGVGHHRRFGGAHAEVEALRACRGAGRDPRGATMWVTLEPCDHTGKTPPCTDAIMDAGLAEVVIAREDPSPAGRGAERLDGAGVVVRFTDVSRIASRLADPFIHRVRASRPWVIAKWAQTIDGRVGTRTGESKWISGERARRDVHRLRARVDAILTGVGTVLADDASLTSRAVRRVRRVARRVVIDPELRTPPGAKVLSGTSETPTTILCAAGAEQSPQAGALRSGGAEVHPIHLIAPGRLDLVAALRWLSEAHEATNVLVEAGPRLTGSLHEAGLIDEIRVFIAPALLGDPEALPAATGGVVERLAGAARFELLSLRRRGDDIAAVYRRPPDQD